MLRGGQERGVFCGIDKARHMQQDGGARFFRREIRCNVRFCIYATPAPDGSRRPMRAHCSVDPRAIWRRCCSIDSVRSWAPRRDDNEPSRPAAPILFASMREELDTSAKKGALLFAEACWRPSEPSHRGERLRAGRAACSRHRTQAQCARGRGRRTMPLRDERLVLRGADVRR